MNIVVRFVTIKEKITQRLLALKLLSKSPSGEELSRFLYDTIQVDAKIEYENIVAFAKDGPAVNGKAMHILTPLLPTTAFYIFLSHSINIAGGEIKDTCNQARHFVNIWANIMVRCGTARLLFKNLTGKSPLIISQVRWFTFWEVASQIHDNYTLVLQVVNDPDDFAREIRDGLKQVIARCESALRLELALIKIVKAE